MIVRVGVKHRCLFFSHSNFKPNPKQTRMDLAQVDMNSHSFQSNAPNLQKWGWYTNEREERARGGTINCNKSFTRGRWRHQRCAVICIVSAVAQLRCLLLDFMYFMALNPVMAINPHQVHCLEGHADGFKAQPSHHQHNGSTGSTKSSETKTNPSEFGIWITSR